MKKTAISIIILLMSVSGIAQNSLNSITVSGTYIYDIQPEYEAKMILSLANVYYDAPGMTLPELKSTYLNSLAKAGITKNAIVEDDLAYALMGYEKEGTIIKLKTKSLEEIQKFLSVKALGVTKSDTSLSYILSNQDVANYTKQAYDDAKAKAEAMAEKIGRKVGNVISLSNTNSNKISESLYYASEFQNREYYIAVSFELL